MGARRGSRNAALLEPAPEKVAGPEVVYVVNRRPLTYRGVEIPVGVEVPDAASWLRIDAWVSARWVRPVAPGEEYRPYDEWLAEAEGTAAEPETPAEGEQEQTTEEG